MLRIGRTWTVRLACGLSALALALAGLAFFPSSAYADEGDPPPTDSGGRRDALLARCLERENEWLSAQAGNLTRAADGLERVGVRIEAARAGGVDTAELEALLAQARSHLSDAQVEHDAAAALLRSHAGFDDDGAVIDREAARETCLDARQALHDARQALVEIRELAVEMREVVRDWVREHGLAPAAAN